MAKRFKKASQADSPSVARVIAGVFVLAYAFGHKGHVDWILLLKAAAWYSFIFLFIIALNFFAFYVFSDRLLENLPSKRPRKRLPIDIRFPWEVFSMAYLFAPYPLPLIMFGPTKVAHYLGIFLVFGIQLLSFARKKQEFPNVPVRTLYILNLFSYCILQYLTMHLFFPSGMLEIVLIMAAFAFSHWLLGCCLIYVKKLGT